MNSLDPRNIVIIFSHGFGIQKDNLGLFTFLSEKLEALGYETVLFDYYSYDNQTKEIHTVPFSEQAKKLQEPIELVKQEYPNKQIVLIGHSQGSIIPSLCDVKGISKVIGISPFFITDKKAVYERYSSREGSTTNFDGISKRKHSNGTTTVIYPEYWIERFNTNQYELYNGLGKDTELVLIYGDKDSLAESVDKTKFKNCKLIKTEGDHDFKGENREKLYEIILNELR